MKDVKLRKHELFPVDASHAVAGFFYCTETERVLLHQRDGLTNINPNRWAFFTGLVEMDESPLAAFVREVYEEIGYTLTGDQVQAFDTYLNVERQTIRHVFFVNIETEFLPEKVNEGAGVGWYTITETLQLDTTDLTRHDLKKFTAHLKHVIE